MNNEEIKNWANWLDRNKNVSLLKNVKTSDFLAAKDKYKFLQDHKNEIRSVPDSPDIIIPNLEKDVNLLLEEYNNINEIPKTYLSKIANKNKISFKELNNALNNKLAENRAKNVIDEETLKREQRRQDIENNLLLKLGLSDISKQRYIDKPEESSIYQEKLKAEGDTTAHPYNNTWSDRADISLGLLGAGADILPGVPGVVLGPSIRLLRTAKQKALGETDKNLVDITTDALKDLGANIGVNYAPTAWANMVKKRASNAASGLKNNISDIIWNAGVIETANKFKKDLKELGSLTKNALTKRNKASIPELNKSGIRTLKEVNIEKKFTDDIKENVFSEDIKNLAKEQNISELDAANILLEKTNKQKDLINNGYDVYTKDNKDILLSNEPIIKSISENISPKVGEYADLIARAKAANIPSNISYQGKEIFNKTFEPITKTVGNIQRESNVPKTTYNKEEQLKKLGLTKENKSNDYEKHLQEVFKKRENDWSKGYITFEERNSPEFKEWYLRNTKQMLGVEN